jgi:hypothetical protein
LFQSGELRIMQGDINQSAFIKAFNAGNNQIFDPFAWKRRGKDAE